MKIQQLLFKLLRKQNVTDGHTDARTDGRTDNVKTVYPTTIKVCGGYNNTGAGMLDSIYHMTLKLF